MKKVLMWNTFEIGPKGGPAGYLYNIKNYCIQNNLRDITFLSDIINIKLLWKDINVKKIILKIFGDLSLSPYIKKTNKLKLFINYVYSKSNYKYFNKIDFAIYDYIHFHSTYEFFKYINLLERLNFRGKTLLTTHTPKPTFMEIIEDWNHLNLNSISYKILKLLENIDILSFEKADILLFPNKYALESYTRWDYFNVLKRKNNFYFIPTGIDINSIKIKRSRDDILKKYKIPYNSFVISYVGRHNKTKGYDILKAFAKKILDKHNDVYFLIAGKEYPLLRLEHKRWIEVGWTNDPHSIINACDLFILPNRETYFDLILLETMYLNKPILLSDTGGNKYFKNKGLNMFFFKNADINNMIEIFEKYIYNRTFKGNLNREYIINNLTVERYIKRYKEMMNNL